MNDQSTVYSYHLHAEMYQIAKRVDSDQPARTAQADLSRYVLADPSKPPSLRKLDLIQMAQSVKSIDT